MYYVQCVCVYTYIILLLLCRKVKVLSITFFSSRVRVVTKLRRNDTQEAAIAFMYTKLFCLIFFFIQWRMTTISRYSCHREEKYQQIAFPLFSFLIVASTHVI